MELCDLFPESAAIVPGVAEESRVDFLKVPGKGAVYLLVGEEEGREVPMLLATVGDLRAALRRRLSDMPAEGKSKRVEYGKVCTRVYWRQVHSALGANFYYGEAARVLFPETAAALIPWRTSWWVAVERAGEGTGTMFPRFRKTNVLTDPGLAYAGPVRDKHAAARLVESLEDLFDLCRYHNVLVQAPNGKACAYKEMGKCPAPCDGSETLGAYRGRVGEALAFLTDGGGAEGARATWRRVLEGEMRAAAAALQFEKAGKIKQRLSRAGLLDGEAFTALGRLEEFAFLSLQPGKGKPWVEPWVVHFAGDAVIQALPQFHVKDVEEASRHLADQARFLGRGEVPRALSAEQTMAAGLVAHHLFKGEADHGVWLKLKAAEEPGEILRAVEMLRAKKAPKPLAERASDVEPAGEAEKAEDDVKSSSH